jgi:hypothetical protein
MPSSWYARIDEYAMAMHRPTLITRVMPGIWPKDGRRFTTHLIASRAMYH